MSWEKPAHWAEIRQVADTLDWHVERWNDMWPDEAQRPDAGPPGPWAKELASEAAALLAAKSVAVARLAERMRSAATSFEETEDPSTTALLAVEDDPALTGR
jgi:hypothetical protein